jgi:hypothetical protein
VVGLEHETHLLPSIVEGECEVEGGMGVDSLRGGMHGYVFDGGDIFNRTSGY